MLTIEATSNWHMKRPPSQGHIAHYHDGYYTEFQLDNYMNETIYLVDEFDNYVECKPAYNYNTEGRCVNVTYRHVNGKKTINNSGIDMTPCDHSVISIPYDDLRKNPVYSKLLNRVITTEEHLPHVTHPLNIAKQQASLTTAIGNRVNMYMYIPFYMFGNDPEGIIKNVYTILNNVVISIPLTHLPTEKAFFCLRVRPADIDDNEYRNYSVQLDDVENKKSHVWETDGFVFSTNKDLLFSRLAIEKKKVEIKEREFSELTEKLETIEEYHKLDREGLVNENERLKTKLADQKAYYEKLIEVRYNEKKADIEIKKLELETHKIESEKSAVKNNRIVEKHKITKELMSTITAALKFFVFAIPLCIGLFKLLKPA